MGRFVGLTFVLVKIVSFDKLTHTILSRVPELGTVQPQLVYFSSLLLLVILNRILFISAVF